MGDCCLGARDPMVGLKQVPERESVGPGQIPSVSVVVPVYNGRRTIAECIEALLAQDYSADRYEIIIVDNNSTDGTPEIVARYPVTLLYEREVQTSYAARNTGIRHAKGEIVAFTDADCIAEPQWLRELVKPFDDPQVGGVGGAVLDYEPTNMVEEFLYCLKPFGGYHLQDAFLPTLITGNAAYRKESLTAVNMFNASLFTIADIDLSWRLQLQTGARVAYAPEARVCHKHRRNLKAMFLQQRRYGFGQILLTSMYKKYHNPTLRPGHQFSIICRQIWALLTYLRSSFYRLLVWRLKGKETMYVATPLLYLVAESGALWGRLSGLWATRFFSIDPSQRVYEDPGER